MKAGLTEIGSAGLFHEYLQTLGITGKSIAVALPLPNRLDQTTIEAAILSGELQPGARLPVEHELMERYGCARMTVSKALQSLAAAGLVERRKRALGAL